MQATRALALLLLVGACLVSSVLADGNGMLPEWAQCGGTSGVCGQSIEDAGPCQDVEWDSPSCPYAFTCTRQSEFYWQCLPDNPDVNPSPSEDSTPAPNGEVPLWGQCGGESGVCGRTGWGACEDAAWTSPICPVGFTCTRDTQWYWQCLPDGETSNQNPESSTSTPYTPTDGVIPQWGQCGGVSGVCSQPGWGACQDHAWESPLCPTDFSCTRQTRYYWQCLPDNASPVQSVQGAAGTYGPADGVIPDWGQCGGTAGVCGQATWGPCVDQIWDTPTCSAGFVCTRDTEYYYQCLPVNAPTPSPYTEESSYPPANPDGVLPPWGQCGGTSGECGQDGWGACQDDTWATPTCPANFVCARQSEWYWQCLPTESSGFPTPAPENSSGDSGYKPTDGVVPKWGQCGGKSGVCGTDGWGSCMDDAWDSPVCPNGYTCTKQTEFYYQCLPDANTPVSVGSWGYRKLLV